MAKILEIIQSRKVDAVGIHERADFFTRRSLKKEAKVKALYLALSMCDLTTLEGADTPGRVIQLCEKAKNPMPPAVFEGLFKDFSSQSAFPSLPAVAAVCVYPSMVAVAARALEGTGVGIASVATAFPAGQSPLEIKLQDVQYAIKQGASEIDMVINRGAFLSGAFQEVYDEIIEVKKACGPVHLKVILETGELGSYDRVRLASDIAMEAGADFIKTSTGKISPAATLPVTLVMLQAISDFYQKTNRKVGMKPAGGIRTAKQATQYLCMLYETLGSEWMTPELFRFGASALVNDILRQITKEVLGVYSYDKFFAVD
jgi:deoxyribose-phosphate aldolase